MNVAGAGLKVAERGSGAAPLGAVATTALLAAGFEIVLAISFAGLIYTGPLTPYLAIGAGTAMFGAIVVVAVTTWRTSLPGAIGSVQDVSAAILALATASIAARFVPGDAGLLPTVLIVIGGTSLVTGVVLWGLGRLRLGQLVRYIPYPVVGGFLAGTGWLLFTGGIGFSAGERELWSSTGLSHLAPAAVVGLLLFFGTRRDVGPALFPGVIVGGIVVFHLVVAVGPGIGEVRAGGWLLGPFPEGGLWPPRGVAWGAVEPGYIVAELPSILTVVALSAMALLLNVTGIELMVDREADTDRELRTGGAANVLAGLGGGLPGFHALSLSAIAQRAGAATPAVGFAAAGLLVATLLLGGGVLALVPRFVFGGVLLYIGFSFLYEWVVDGATKLVRADHAIVLLILIVIAAVGFLQGVGVGIAATVALFIVAYSREEVVRHELTGAEHPSRVDRSAVQAATLRARPEAITVLELHGYLFFGTAHRLLERLRDHLLREGPDDDRSYLVLDLRRVTGMDSSTVMSLHKAAQLAVRHRGQLVLTGVHGRSEQELRRSGLLDADGVHTEVDLDHGVEWCEEQLLADVVSATDVVPDLRGQLVDALGSRELADAVLRYLEPFTVGAGEVVIGQDDEACDLYFLVEGELTATIADRSGEAMRLRRMLSGSVVGEIGFYAGGRRTASVVADTPCWLARLTPEGLAHMEADAPAAAAALHRLLARRLASRLSATLRTVVARGG